MLTVDSSGQYGQRRLHGRLAVLMWPKRCVWECVCVGGCCGTLLTMRGHKLLDNAVVRTGRSCSDLLQICWQLSFSCLPMHWASLRHLHVQARWLVAALRAALILSLDCWAVVGRLAALHLLPRAPLPFLSLVYTCARLTLSHRLRQGRGASADTPVLSCLHQLYKCVTGRGLIMRHNTHTLAMTAFTQ